MKIWESIETLISQSGSSLGGVRVHSFTLSYTPGSMRCDSRASLLARNLASPCLAREPKAKVATDYITKLRKGKMDEEILLQIVSLWGKRAYYVVFLVCASYILVNKICTQP
jgi:hypothetical protein